VLEKEIMIKNILLAFLVGITSFTSISWNSINNYPIIASSFTFDNYAQDLYKELNDTNLKFEAFDYALKGYLKLATKNELQNSDFLTIIDMSLSSNSNRFFIINIKDKKIIHQSRVAHGQNTGLEYAQKFSNTINSHQTSLGFYKTAETYQGKHGLSLRLDGLEFSNNNARKRAIVIHAADYVSESFINSNGRLGRSYGCPSLPRKDYKKIIEKIKEGSALFIYYPNKTYLNKSSLANSNKDDLDISNLIASN